MLVAASAAFAPWASGLSLPLRALLSLAVVLVAVSGLRRHLRPEWHRVSWQSDAWHLVDAEGREHDATLTGHRDVFGGSVRVLRFGLRDGSRCHVVLAPDNLDAETRRRLTLLLARADAVRGTVDRP